MKKMKYIKWIELGYGGFIVGLALADIWAGLHGYRVNSFNLGIAYIGLLVWFVLYREYREMNTRSHKLIKSLIKMNNTLFSEIAVLEKKKDL